MSALVGIGYGRRIDAGAGFELPQRLAGGLIESDELAIHSAGEQQPAISCEHACGNHSFRHWHFPLRLAGQWIERHVIAPRLARRRSAEARLDASRALTEHELKFRVLQNPGDFPGVHIHEPGLRVECHQRCIGAARRPDFDRLSFDGLVVDIGQNRAAGL